MLIQTADFGSFEVDASAFIHFPKGIYSFENIHQYALFHFDEIDTAGLFFLQSTESIHPAFAVIDPWSVFHEYNPQVSANDLQTIQCDHIDDLRFLVIAIIPDSIENAYVNLKSPIIINSKNNKGMQVILEDNVYSLRHKLFPSKGDR